MLPAIPAGRTGGEADAPPACAPHTIDRIQYDVNPGTQWRNTADVRRLHAMASIVSADRIVFDIKGNSYRPVRVPRSLQLFQTLPRLWSDAN